MYYRKTLSNGIRVIGEKINHFRSVSIGVWIGAGSCWETAEINGISHFLEHMFFKGTYNRKASEIAGAIDSIGGQINAFTAKECTCLYAKVMDEHIKIAVDVLSDMLLNSKFDPEEIKKEIGVVSEEILMSEDSPEDVAHDLLAKAYFDTHPLGMTILGTKESLATFERKTLLDYIERLYVPSNIVIAVAGGFDEAALGDMLEETFGKMPARKGDIPCECKEVHENKKCVLKHEKDIEQLNQQIA
ncbi:MAG TPA: pitrilysin family protein, partial [Clostridia bacterium]|nr:pitrilysin family protein [Clostridia bacterium]